MANEEEGNIRTQLLLKYEKKSPELSVAHVFKLRKEELRYSISYYNTPVDFCSNQNISLFQMTLKASEKAWVF